MRPSPRAGGGARAGAMPLSEMAGSARNVRTVQRQMPRAIQGLATRRAAPGFLDRAPREHERYHGALVQAVFVKDGFRFFFYKSDHEPMHVRVRKGGGEAVFNVEGGVELRESVGFKVGELRRAQALAEAHRQAIVDRWRDHFG